MGAHGMMVTKIEEINNKKVRVFIDNEFAFVLYKGELRLYKVKEGEEICDEAYSEIVEKVLPKRAKLRCMNLLKARAYTEKQLRDKLLQGEYTEKLIDVAIGYVKSYGYIDDRKYAEDYIAYHMENKNRKRMELDLYRKGITENLSGKYWMACRRRGKFPMNYLWLKKFL